MFFLNKIEIIISFLTVFIIVFIVFSINETIQEQKEWDKFAEEYNCQVVEHRKSEVLTGHGYGMMTNNKFGYGTIVSTLPSKTAYRCDDNVIYWR